MWLRKRIVWQSGMIAAAFLIVGVAAAWHVFSLQRKNSELLETNVASIRAAEEIEIMIREARHELDQYMLSHDDSRLGAVLAKQHELTSWVGRARTLSRTELEAEFLANIESGLSDFFNQLREETRDGEKAVATRAIGSLAEELLTQRVLPYSHQFLELNEAEVIESSRQNMKMARRVALGFLSLGACGAIAGLVAGFGAARGITRSVLQLTLPIRDVAGALDDVVGPIEVTTSPSLDDLETTLQAVSAKVEAVVEQLQQRHREVIHADQLAAVGQLAAGMAHELRNPLMCVKTLVQSTRRRGDSAHLDSKDLEVMEVEINRLDKQLQAFLDFARPPSLDTREVDLVEMICQTVDLLKKKAETRAVTMDCRLPDEALPVEVDAAQIRQVVLNLLLNALDAVDKGGAIWIEAGRQRSDPRAGGGKDSGSETIWLRVSDNGHGLPAEARDRLCEPFFSTKETGLGLGLAVSKRILDAHHGDLVALDRDGRGAVFEIRLPRQPS